jgi:hypothetical protein
MHSTRAHWRGGTPRALLVGLFLRATFALTTFALALLGAVRRTRIVLSTIDTNSTITTSSLDVFGGFG